MPKPVADFEGLSSADSQVKVPMADTSGSAGRFAFGEVINMAIGFFSKSTGQPLCAPQTTQQMWTGTACASGAFSDAVLRYDTLAHRWIVAKPGSGGYCIAVSQGEDPTAGWFRYEFPVSVPGEPAGADFWKLSVWRDSYTFSTRDLVRPSLHASAGAAIYGDYVAAFQRNAMLSGRPASAVEFLVPQTPAPADAFYLLPASAEGSAIAPARGAAAPFVQRFEGTSDRLDVWNLDVDWQHPAAATFTRTAELPVAPYTSDVPAVTQPPIAGAQVPTLSPDATVLEQPLIWRRTGGRDTIYGALTTAVPSPAGTHAGIRWFELQDIRHRWDVTQQGTYAPADGSSRWLESLNVDRHGDIAMVFNVSGPHRYPSLHYTGRLPADPPGTMRTEQTLINGAGSQGPGALGSARATCQQDCPFGDYSQTSVDPVDGCTFWVAGEYYPSQAQASDGEFATRIGSFRFPGCHSGRPD